MKTLLEYQDLIIKWADERQLLVADEKTKTKQLLKTLEEVGELAGGLAKGSPPLVKDAIGDVLVTLIIFSKLNDFDYFSAKYYELLNSGMYSFDKKADCNASLFGLCYELLEFKSLITEDNRYSFSSCIKTSIFRLYNIAYRCDMTLEECLDCAWNAIKDRKGKTINGVFIKNES